MDGRWKTITAGILELVSGAAALTGVLVLLFISLIAGAFLHSTPYYVVLSICLLLALILLIAAMLAIIGGISSLRRTRWGLALAGSIAALFPWWPLGVMAIVLIVLSKENFSQAAEPGIK
jgi:hypothetical protein